ncbi:MipA/OmpV family protein [Vibrio maerlii]|uniref:MipA/OmpV family protein n=1 Tax=Vibrio maerlii TaxID=2231648 RepID=UPI000E3D7FD8|nr:MipA/OmpV family protein [Vibrio maerlii]
MISGLSAACLALPTYAENSEQEWGIAGVMRSASIPYQFTQGDDNVSTFIPMIYFENEYLYAEGTEAGVYLFNEEESDFRLSTLLRMRFIDVPKEEQNAIEGDTADFGFQLRYQPEDTWYIDSEFMSDDDFNFHANLRWGQKFDEGALELEPSVTLRYKDADFNSLYYGLGVEDIGAGADLKASIDAKYHVVSNLYLLGGLGVTVLDNNAYQSSVVDERFQGEAFLGFGFFNEKGKPRKSDLRNKPYLRIAHGWATPSNLGDIMKFNTEKDPNNGQMTSFFYGHPLTDELFGLPLDIYLTPGIAHHWSSDVQSSSTEYIGAIKAYYTFTWPVRWRFGVAEGLSYIDNVTFIEENEIVNEKEYDSASKLLNYLDFSFDINIGDVFNNSDWKGMWLGYTVHHRSAIFEKASQYGRIKGGSNYNSIYFQYEF